MPNDFPTRSYDEWKTRVDEMPNPRHPRIAEDAVDGPNLPTCTKCHYFIDECVCDDLDEDSI